MNEREKRRKLTRLARQHPADTSPNPSRQYRRVPGVLPSPRVGNPLQQLRDARAFPAAQEHPRALGDGFAHGREPPSRYSIGDPHAHRARRHGEPARQVGLRDPGRLERGRQLEAGHGAFFRSR